MDKIAFVVILKSFSLDQTCGRRSANQNRVLFKHYFVTFGRVLPPDVQKLVHRGKKTTWRLRACRFNKKTNNLLTFRT